MCEFEIRLNEKALSKLLLGGEFKIRLEDSDGNYKLENLTSMTSRVVEPGGRKVKRAYVLFCTASRHNSEYKVRIELIGVQDEIWYIGKIIFPRAPV